MKTEFKQTKVMNTQKDTINKMMTGLYKLFPNIKYLVLVIVNII